ncbi:MAG: type II toxin-antitoxin system Phd/YefM family antitoxin [Methanomicrobiales archaeon]|jgi:prevent-host-death family protein|nr:type II toxin-antitoxin system Phd/YefM family antitoxin [Methanomicrobiales archaeon]
MIITATEFKANLGHYLELVEKEDIVITRNGKRIAKLTNIANDRTDTLRSLIGILPSDISLEVEKEKRLSEIGRQPIA